MPLYDFFPESTPLLSLTTPVPTPTPADIAPLEQDGFGPGFGPDFTPRNYREALSPTSAPRLGRRQAGDADGQENCEAGQHSCEDLGALAAGKCCPDTQYCFLNTTWAVQCCRFGAGCDEDCDETQYRCNGTTVHTDTTTLSSVAAAAAVDTRSGRETASVAPIPADTVQIFTRTSTFLGCCPRLCPGPQKLCPSSLGGGCCPLGQLCASDAKCLSFVSPTPTPLVSTDNGCDAATKTPCTDPGGACCARGQTCTLAGTVYGCAGVPDGPDDSNIVYAAPASFPPGAIAGIGAAVAVAAALLIGLLTWLVRRRRRRRRLTAGTPSYGTQPSGGGGAWPNFRPAATTAATTPAATTITAAGDVSEMGSMGSNVSMPPSRPPLHQSGLVYDYFGPIADKGPYYTGDDHVPRESPPPPGRGVPLRPHGPDDIAAPVEMDSRLRDAYHEGPFELYAWPRSPSPLSPDDASHTQFATPRSRLSGRLSPDVGDAGRAP